MKRWFVETHGAEALLPNRKEPIPYDIVDCILAFPDGTQVGNEIVDRSRFLWRSLFSKVALFKVTGFRKAEASSKSRDTTSLFGLLTRASVNWFRVTDVGESMVQIAPSLQSVQWMWEYKDDPMVNILMGIQPPPSKADQTGDRYGNFMVYVQLDGLVTNAACNILLMEMEHPVYGRDQRKLVPLFGPVLGESFTHSQVDLYLPRLLQAVCVSHPHLLQAEHIRRYSWHSFRIALACALRSMMLADGSRGVTDETIQALCRWATPTSLKAYARLDGLQYANLLTEASKVRFNNIQAASLWKEAPLIDDDHRYELVEQLALTAVPAELN
jgi:hypothetical protein